LSQQRFFTIEMSDIAEFQWCVRIAITFSQPVIYSNELENGGLGDNRQHLGRRGVNSFEA